ncbi:hypothetical protein [Acidisoma silvae]|uniref:Uncharacterized protein n=1 Tax=Acidisoma silvae TaxID=2802396 RepID=A0A963YRV8_9PROT|nr:hypothetical protein [Acidisoma silvae]MCB8875953.1 hypothetical protein [Acidisoma silvae]
MTLAWPITVFTGFLGYLWATARLMKPNDRKNVFESVRIFSYIFFAFAITIFASVKLGFFSGHGQPSGPIGQILNKIFLGEMNLKCELIAFMSGLTLIYGPRLLTWIICGFLGCLPERANKSGMPLADGDMFPANIEPKLVAMRQPAWFQKLMSPTYLLVLLLAKAFITCAAALMALSIVGGHYEWFSAPWRVRFTSAACASALLTFASLTFFCLEPMHKFLHSEDPWLRLLSSIFSCAKTKVENSCLFQILMKSRLGKFLKLLKNCLRNIASR